MPRILLLEDDGAFALDVKRALAPLDCDVTTVADGNAGLARAVSDRFDLIIVSAELRGMNGFRVCNRLKKDPAAKPTPLLMMWAEASSSALEEHIKLATRADRYVRKPFAPSDLRGQVRAFVPSLAGTPSLQMAAVVVPPGFESKPRLRTVSGVEPVPVGASPLSPAAVIEGLKRELVTAQADHATTAPLRALLSKLEEDNARLIRELQAARARPVPPPLPIAARHDPESNAVRELGTLRQRLTQKDNELVALRGELEIAKHDADAKERALGAERGRVVVAETDRVRVAQTHAQVAVLEKASAALRAERDLALKRADEARRSIEQAVDAAEKTRTELEAERQARVAATEALARESGRRERERAAIEAQHNADLAAATAQHGQELIRATSVLQQEIERTRTEAAEKVAAAASETAAAIAERDATLEQQRLELQKERDATKSQIRETVESRLRAAQDEKDRRIAEIEIALGRARIEAAEERAARAALATAHSEELEAITRLHEDDRSNAELRWKEDEGIHLARFEALSGEHQARAAELERARLELETSKSALTQSQRKLTASESAHRAALETAQRAARESAERAADVASADERLAALAKELRAAQTDAKTQVGQLSARVSTLTAERDEALKSAATVDARTRARMDELEQRSHAAGAAEQRLLELEISLHALTIERDDARVAQAADQGRLTALAAEHAELQRAHALRDQDQRRIEEERATLKGEMAAAVLASQTRERASAARDAEHRAALEQARSEAERTAQALRGELEAERKIRESASLDLEAAHADRDQLWAERAELRSALGAQEEARALAVAERAIAEQAAHAASAAALEERTKLIAEHEARTAWREAAYEVAQRAHEEALSALSRSMDSERAELTAKLRAEQTGRAEIVAAAAAEHARELAELRVEHDIQVAAARRELGAERVHEEEAVKALERTVADLRAQAATEQHARSVEAAKVATAHAAALSQRAAERDAERAELQRNHLAAIESLKREHELLARAEKHEGPERDEALALVRARHAEELAAARLQGAQQAERADKFRRAAETAHAKELATRQDQHRTAKRALETAAAESRAAADAADARVELLEKTLANRDRTLSDNATLLDERAREIAALAELLAVRVKGQEGAAEAIAARDVAVLERDAATSARIEAIAQRDAAVTSIELAEKARNEAAEARDAALTATERAVVERDQALARCGVAALEAVQARADREALVSAQADAAAAFEKELAASQALVDELRTHHETEARALETELARRAAENKAAVAAVELIAREELDATKVAMTRAEERVHELERQLTTAHEVVEAAAQRTGIAEAESRRVNAELATARDAMRADLERRLLEQQKAHAAVIAARDRAQNASELRYVSEQAEKRELQGELASVREAAANAAAKAQRENDDHVAAVAKLQQRIEAEAAAAERERRRAKTAEQQHGVRLADAERTRIALATELRAGLAQALSERDASIAAREQDATRLAAEHASALDAIRAATSQQVAELVREHGAALEAARSNERASAIASAEALVEQRISEATNRVKGEAELAEAARQATLDAEMREWTTQRDLEHQTLVERIADLEKRVADGREALDEERRDRLREELETTRNADDLEARVQSGKEHSASLERALAEVRDEVPALEDEISALRAELTALRGSMESESTLLRVANAQLERNRRLLDRAKEALVELVADGDEAADGDKVAVD